MIVAILLLTLAACGALGYIGWMLHTTLPELMDQLHDMQDELTRIQAGQAEAAKPAPTPKSHVEAEKSVPAPKSQAAAKEAAPKPRRRTPARKKAAAPKAEEKASESSAAEKAEKPEKGAEKAPGGSQDD